MANALALQQNKEEETIYDNYVNCEMIK